MSYEKTTDCCTAEDLYQALADMPADCRERAQVIVLLDEDQDPSVPASVTGYQLIEGGEIQNGLQIYVPKVEQ